MSRLHALTIVGTLAFALGPACGQSEGPGPGMSADGTRLLGADGKPLVLRGANWGWWSCVESGDAELLHAWGGDLIRISFMWSKIVAPGSEEPAGERLALLDAMVGWAEDAGVWYVLDCQEPPGGCNTAPSCFGGKNALWAEDMYQTQCVRMWKTLAKRYRQRRWLLAYELMNEPTPPEKFTVEQYRALLLRNIDAIRSEDPERFVVVSGLGWSAVSGLTDAIVLPRPRLIYTFHFYAPGSVTQEAATYPGRATLEVKWLGNSPEAWGAEGDTDWTLLQRTFQAPTDVTHGQIMLRSDNNAGAAWFDDVALACAGRLVDLGPNTDFRQEAQRRGWKQMRPTAGRFAWDGTEGHGAPGSLRITGTDSYNAWMAEVAFPAHPGAIYTLSCWVNTRGATGRSYPAVAWFRHHDEAVDRAWLRARIAPALSFSQRNHVPVWCGEFGCSQSNPDGSGARWMGDVGEILSDLGIPWTFWDWRETTGRGGMTLWMQEGGHYVVQRPLANVIRDLLAPPRQGRR